MIIPYATHRRSVNALMEEAGRHSVPTPEEERRLIAAAKRGNKKATHRMVLGNLRFVIKMAHSLGRNADVVEELMAAGISGLMESLKTYCQQASKGGRFIHYAAFHIRRKMRVVLNGYRTPVSANPNNYDIARKIFEHEEKCLKERGFRPSHAETGKRFGLTANRVERMKKLFESPLYLDHAVSGEDERSGHDICADARGLSPSILAEKQTENEILTRLMREHLSPREIMVLERRFGLKNGGEEENLEAISGICNLSRERVRQIEVEALKKMRFHLSQTCPLYHERAVAMGHPAIVHSKLPVRAKAAKKVPEAAPAVARKSAPLPAPKMVFARVEERELEECVA